MDFRERLQNAANRGARARSARETAEAAEALSEEECRRLHSQHRLELSDHIEACIQQLADNFPGFRVETIVDDKGWGAGVSRDDLGIRGGKRNNFFSRLQVVVEPFNSYQVVAIGAKGAVRNKESFTRNHYDAIGDYDAARFKELIETWVLDYAELYAASS
ncbi:MAG: hypothetical protein AAGB00_03065 [Planctomycetota bacterium]